MVRIAISSHAVTGFSISGSLANCDFASRGLHVRFRYGSLLRLEELQRTRHLLRCLVVFRPNGELAGLESHQLYCKRLVAHRSLKGTEKS